MVKCRDCKDTKVYQGLGAPEPCRSCQCDGAQRSMRNDLSAAKGPIDDSELMRLLDLAAKSGANLDTMLKGRKLVVTVTH